MKFKLFLFLLHYRVESVPVDILTLKYINNVGTIQVVYDPVRHFSGSFDAITHCSYNCDSEN